VDGDDIRQSPFLDGTGSLKTAKVYQVTTVVAAARALSFCKVCLEEPRTTESSLLRLASRAAPYPLQDQPPHQTLCQEDDETPHHLNLRMQVREDFLIRLRSDLFVLLFFKYFS
jgi:hypothetical protein